MENYQKEELSQAINDQLKILIELRKTLNDIKNKLFGYSQESWRNDKDQA